MNVEGVDNTATGRTGRTVAVPVSIVVDGVTYTQIASMLYKTNAGKTGSAKTPPVKK